MVPRRSSSRTPLAPSLHSRIRSPSLQLDGEQVGGRVVHPVERLEDQVAVRVHPRLGLGDPALVDQALHEGVVVGELGDLALPPQVGPAVADVAQAQHVAVEGGQGGGGAGAGDRRVLLDQLRDPVVRPVQRAGDPGQQRLAVGVRGRLVEPAQHGDRGAGGEVAAGGAAHPVADREQPGTGVPAVLVVLADPADVGDRRVVELLRRVTDRGHAGPLRGVDLLLDRGHTARQRRVARHGVVLGVGHDAAYFRSSRIVLPIRTCVPRVMVVGWVIRAAPT